jgi:hypothetical protein
MRFECKYCRIRWTLTEFAAIEAVQDTQCYVTLVGVNHSLKAVLE